MQVRSKSCRLMPQIAALAIVIFLALVIVGVAGYAAKPGVNTPGGTKAVVTVPSQVSAASLTAEASARYANAATEADVQQAIAQLQQALSLEPDFVPANTWLGVVLSECVGWRNHKHEAISLFHKVLALHPTGDLAIYVKTAQPYLRKLEGRSKTFLLVPAVEMDSDYEAMSEILSASLEGSLGANCKIHIPFTGRESEQDDLANRMGADGNLGWVLFLDVTEVTPAHYEEEEHTDKKGKVIRVERGYNDAKVSARVRLYDPIAKETVAICGESGSSGNGFAKTPGTAMSVAIEEAKLDEYSILATIQQENKELTQDAGFLSVPTNQEGVYAKCLVIDRATAHNLPRMLLMPVKLACEPAGADRERVSDSLSRSIGRWLTYSGQIGVVYSSHIKGMPGITPDTWNVAQAVQFASTLGNCKWVAFPRVTLVKSKHDSGGFFSLSSGEYECVLEFDVTLVHVANPSESQIHYCSVEGKTKGDLQQWSVYDAARRGGGDLWRQFRRAQKLSPRVALADFEIDDLQKELKPSLSAAGRQFAQTMPQVDCDAVILEVGEIEEAVEGLTNSEDRTQALINRAVALSLVAELKKFEIEIDKKDGKQIATVKAAAKTRLYGSNASKEVASAIEESFTVQVDVTDMPKDTKKELYPPIQQAAVQAAEEAARLVIDGIVKWLAVPANRDML